MALEECAAFVGIDWADRQHAVCLIDPRTTRREHRTLDQEPEAIDQWVAQLQQRFPGQMIAVCLEQKRGALIYALMKFDNLLLIPINPQQLASFRKALGPSGAKDDPTDAELLAEFIVKHPDRVRPWRPDDVQTRKIRLLAEARRNLVNDRTGISNRLKNALKQYFPLALDVTGERLFAPLACALLTRYPTLEQLQAASDDELRQFYRDHNCYRKSVVEKRLRAIRQAKALTLDRAIIESSVLVVAACVAQLAALSTSIAAYDVELETLMASHPDAKIFKAFPGAGDAMAPRLLAAMGTDRDRLDDAQEVQQMSGVAPVTKRSGKSNVVHRRRACNKFLLQTFHEFAALSRKWSAWAQAYYDMLRSKGHKHHAAVRALAFKWIRIIFRCWKDRTKYNELAYCTALIKRNSPIIQYLANNPTQPQPKP